MKTAISLDDDLYREAQTLARKMNVSRSRLFATAMAEYIERRRNRELSEAISAAYSEAPDAAERKLLRLTRTRHRQRVQGRW